MSKSWNYKPEGHKVVRKHEDDDADWRRSWQEEEDEDE